MRKHKTIEQRFWGKVIPEPNSGCWLWTGAVNNKGYGKMGLGRKGEGVEHAHRISWNIHFGLIPVDAWVLHKCDTPACCNPSHLFLGDRKANMRDCSMKGRLRYHNGLRVIAENRKSQSWKRK